MRIALYQPDIPQNTGAVIRICACFNLALDLIEPCGFVLDDNKLKRCAMDYGALTAITRHLSFQEFLKSILPQQRLILLTTKGDQALNHFAFKSDDVLLFGRESSGVSDEVRKSVSAQVYIPMADNARSFNLAISVGITCFQALNDLDLF